MNKTVGAITKVCLAAVIAAVVLFSKLHSVSQAITWCEGYFLCCYDRQYVDQPTGCDPNCADFTAPYSCAGGNPPCYGDPVLQCVDEGQVNCQGSWATFDNQTCEMGGGPCVGTVSSVDCGPPSSPTPPPSQTCAQAGGTCRTGISSCSVIGATALSGTCSSGRCCSAPVEVCGNESCGTGENSTNCPDDCGTPEWCGNGSCNTAAGENCGNCSLDCTSGCGTCGDFICDAGAGENCATCSNDCSCGETCGNGYCAGAPTESCADCSIDCGSCITDFCGDDVCNGFELCSTCQDDCGACLTDGWWRTRGGAAYAGATSGTAMSSQVPDSTTCVEPTCIPAVSVYDGDDTPNSDGIPTTGGGLINVNSYYTERTPQTYVIGAAISNVEDYDYFYRLYSLGSTPTDDFSGSADNAQEPTINKAAYYHLGNMTVQSQWDITSGESYVIFVEGDLTFSDPGGVEQLVQVEEGGFLAFIVSGDIIVEETVGNSSTTSGLGNLEGVYIADGTLTIESLGAGKDERFVGRGMFAAHSGVSLLRDFRDSDNGSIPVEVFVYRPDFVVNVPTQMTKSQIIWQETN